jgi:hypothetical protein
VDFGEVHVRAPGFRDRVAYRAATVSAFLFIPVNEDLRIYGEVGALFWQQKMNFEDMLGSFDAKKDEVSLLLGVGASYRIRHTPLSLTARYDHYFEVGALRRTGHDNDIDRIALGVAWVF